VTFGSWRALATVSPPRKPGLLQARTEDLIAYPRGKSAMVYYDGDEDLAQALARLCARVPPGTDVRVRFGECRDPEVQLLRKLDEFRRRFGTLPSWNDPAHSGS
jgi:hypothetical protein